MQNIFLFKKNKNFEGLILRQKLLAFTVADNEGLNEHTNAQLPWCTSLRGYTFRADFKKSTWSAVQLPTQPHNAVIRLTHLPFEATSVPALLS